MPLESPLHHPTHHSLVLPLYVDAWIGVALGITGSFALWRWHTCMTQAGPRYVVDVDDCRDDNASVGSQPADMNGMEANTTSAIGFRISRKVASVAGKQKGHVSLRNEVDDEQEIFESSSFTEPSVQ